MDMGFVDTCLGEGLEGKLALAESHGLWLEFAYTGNSKADITVFENYNVPIRTVQAYLLHEMHWLSPDKAVRKAAEHHVLDAIRFAEEAGASNVLTVPTYGFELLTNPREECIKNYRRILKDTSLNLLVEHLTPNRTSFIPSPVGIASLVSEIGDERVKMVVDTLHLRDSGYGYSETIVKYADLIAEVHLRDNVFEEDQKQFTPKDTSGSSRGKPLCLELEKKSVKEFTQIIKKVRKIKE